MTVKTPLSMAAVFCALILTSGAWADVIYVDDDAPASGDGTSWAKAYRYLQDALAVAVEGNEVRAGQGVYRPDRSSAQPDGTGYQHVYFLLPEGVVLRGGYAGLGASDPDARDIQTYATIISGDLEGNDATITDPWASLDNDPTRIDNSEHVIVVHEANPNTMLSGLVISGAYRLSPTMQPTFIASVAGLWVENGAQVAVRDCTFCGNVSPAMLCMPHSEVHLTDCVFKDNINKDESDGSLLLCDASAHLVRCAFERNYSHMGSGGISCYSGNSDLHLQDCAFRYNASMWGWPGSSTGGYFGNVGGAISSNGFTELIGCEFRGNSAGAGGAVSAWGSVTARDCTFQDNRALDVGGAMLLQGATSEITGCFFSSGSADAGGAVYQELGQSRFTACLFSGNSGLQRTGGAVAVHGGPLTGMRSRIGQAFDATFGNCTFAGNVAPIGGTISCRTAVGEDVDPGAVMLLNCIVEGSGDKIDCRNTDMTIVYTNLCGGLGTVQDLCDDISWGPGNLDIEPLFAVPGYWDDNGTANDPADDFFVEGDYHLKSQAGRWDAASESWVQDEVASPCIDAGDPNSPVMYEPFPNGGIINMGAYGGTAEASKSYFGDSVCQTIIAGDINGDCKVDINDLLLLISHWTDE